jgi:aspartate aminotransferase
MIQLSDRINLLAESETLAMTRISRELQSQGKDVINLSIGEPDFNTPDFIKEAGKAAIDENFSHYTPVPGYLDLRQAICKKFKRDNNLDYSPDQIVVSTGAKHSLMNVVLAIVNPGDEVIVPIPYWVSYKEMIKFAGGVEVNIAATIEHDFKITAKQLDATITPKTKLFMFNSPSNPTGSIYHKHELEALAKVMEKHPHVLILSDEIYEHINFAGKHESFGQFEALKDRVVTVNGVSKGFAMTGWRIGFIGAPLYIAQACVKLQGQFTSGTSSIAQKAALAALNADPKEMKEMKAMLSKFKERRDLLLELLKEIPGVKTNVPDGAFYVFPDVSSFYGKSDGTTTIKNGADLCNYILYSVFVALVPGSAFGDNDCIRISYATSNEVLIEAVRRIKIALSNLS